MVKIIDKETRIDAAERSERILRAPVMNTIWKATQTSVTARDGNVEDSDPALVEYFNEWVREKKDNK